MVYRVEFQYLRTVVTHLEAESEEAIHKFLEDNPEWDILKDAEEIIDEDETDSFDSDEYDVDEYVVLPSEHVTADYGIHEGEIIEVEE